MRKAHATALLLATLIRLSAIPLLCTKYPRLAYNINVRTMINTDRGLLRIEGNKIMRSVNGGAWCVVSTIPSSEGIPKDLTDNGNEILLTTDRKVLSSTDGSGWHTVHTLPDQTATRTQRRYK